jgi:hypothetical protein
VRLRPRLQRRELLVRRLEPLHVRTDVHVHAVGHLQLSVRSALVALALVAACSDAKPRPTVVEEPDAATEDSNAPVVDAGADAACTLSHAFGSSSCNACVAQTCCVQVEACYADSACKKLVDCLIACLDTPDAGGCAQTCEEATPDEKELWSKLQSCIYFNPPCEEHCAVTR